MDASPSPIALSSPQAPELSAAGGNGVTRPRLRDGREGGKDEVREEGREVKPGPSTVGGTGRKVSPCAEAKPVEGPKGAVVVKPGEA